MEFKTPHEVIIPELLAGLHQIYLGRNVKNQDNIFSFMPPASSLLWSLRYSHMINNEFQYSYICTEEAFVFLQISKNDPTVV